MKAHTLRAVETHGANVGGFKPVLTHHFTTGAVDGVLVIRHVHTQDVRRVEQACGVICQPEDGCAMFSCIGTYALKYAHAIMQGVSQDMDLRFSPRDKFPIKPDNAIPIIHRHPKVSSKKVNIKQASESVIPPQLQG